MVKLNQKEIENRLNSIEKDRKRLKIEINDTILTLNSDSLYNRRPNLLEHNFELPKLNMDIHGSIDAPLST